MQNQDQNHQQQYYQDHDQQQQSELDNATNQIKTLAINARTYYNIGNIKESENTLLILAYKIIELLERRGYNITEFELAE